MAKNQNIQSSDGSVTTSSVANSAAQGNVDTTYSDQAGIGGTTAVQSATDTAQGNAQTTYSDQAGISNTKAGGMADHTTQRTNAQTIYSDSQFEGMKTPINRAQTQTTNMQGQVKSSGGQAIVTALFSTRKDAERAVDELKRQGFSDQEINVISKDKGTGAGDRQTDDVMDGALTGSTLGGIGGLVLGAGALAIPGVGPIIAAGPIAAALTGAVAGGVAGALIDWGIPADVSRQYEQSVSRGDSLVFVRTSGAKAQQAQGVLRNSGAKKVESH